MLLIVYSLVISILVKRILEISKEWIKENLKKKHSPHLFHFEGLIKQIFKKWISRGKKLYQM